MFKILVDTREKAILKFGCDWERKCLPVADYGASFYEGHLYPVIFERKSCNDLYGSLTQNYDRFRKMFKRAEDKGIKVIICIEGTRERILKGCDHSARDPESIIRQLETIRAKYNVEHIFFGNRVAMSNYIHDVFYQAYEKYLEELKNGT